ncbi:carboxypeptidase-like regulatory domain-containing protein [Chitinophaga sp. GbtcB8]|uniref:carboxypeptidase-like regulatory domain-containing protein n=1 Tax=Chitinophaga sp. GbtcB8 TaxID=2824753 RepID=UPI001C2F970A|nr:carboxypeptidase-like regulatory domain-containing protein [Chitinophaga sp. GbtcB8]
MTPAEGGRFCTRCQHEVIDFSLMTDKEILAVISSRNKNLCGRFQSAQLNRSLHEPLPPKRSFFPAAVFASLIAALVPEGSKAQTPADATVQSIPTKVVPTKSRATAVFKGQIIDSLTGKGLAGVTISLKHKGVEGSGAITDGEGKFDLKIPARLKQQILTVNISYIGYTSRVVPFDMDQQLLSTTIELKQSNIDLPEIAVIGYGTKTGLVVITGTVSIVSPLEATSVKEETRKRTWWWRITHPFRRR